MSADGERAASHRAHLAGDRFAGVELAARDDRIGAVRSERTDDFEPKTAAAAGDQRNLAAQVEEGVIHERTPVRARSGPAPPCAVSAMSVGNTPVAGLACVRKCLATRSK